MQLFNPERNPGRGEEVPGKIPPSLRIMRAMYTGSGTWVYFMACMGYN